MSDIPLEKIFAALRENNENDDEGLSSLGKGAKAELLMADYEHYVSPCPFKPGDIITPKKHHNLRGAGDPNVVMEVFERPKCADAVLGMVIKGEPHTRAWSPNMRIINVAGGQVMSFYEESYNYEPYTGPKGKILSMIQH
jgi:hypothetical protein